MKSIPSILALCSALCLSIVAMSGPLSQSASAASHTSSDDAKSMNLAQACQGDIQKYCSDVSKGEGRIFACLKAHDDKLSSDCSKQWTQAKTQAKKTMKEMHEACSSDVQKFCSDSASPHEVGSCLQSHESDLSASCKNFRQQFKMTG